MILMQVNPMHNATSAACMSNLHLQNEPATFELFDGHYVRTKFYSCSYPLCIASVGFRMGKVAARMQLLEQERADYID